ncbi:MAG: PaaI family thioesterase [Hydrogenophaga sp.]|nr:PaaI family thioesterase [Hydrogenophaga sp.]
MQAPPASALDNPFLELIGARLADWRDGYSEFHLPVRAELLNRQGVLQGGVLSTLLDVACGYAGLYTPPSHEPSHGHTVSLTVNFINKGSHGLVVTKGFLVQRARTLFFARSEAWIDGTVLLATAQGSFKLTAGRSK